MISDRNNAIIYGANRSPRYISGQRKQVEYQRFSAEYFSGCDVTIYFGDILVDEVIALQFSMVENVAPIYGYASYTYDAIARGNRLIQGTFRIAFKEAYYLHAITNELENQRKNGTANIGGDLRPFSFEDSYIENTIEGLLAAVKSKPSGEFEDLADDYERSLWGAGNEAFGTRIAEQETTTYFYPDDPNTHRQENLHKDGFNIMVVYGAMERETPLGGDDSTINGTVKTIVGVQLTGVSQVVDPSGQPLYEEYSFIARDLDGDFSKPGKY